MTQPKPDSTSARRETAKKVIDFLKPKFVKEPIFTVGEELLVDMVADILASASQPKASVEERIARGERGIAKIPDSPDTRHAKAEIPQPIA